MGHMKAVSISELKANLARYVRAVQRGTDVQILHRGRPVAVLSRVEADESRGGRERLIRSGLLRPRKVKASEALAVTPALSVRGLQLLEALESERTERL